MSIRSAVKFSNSEVSSSVVALEGDGLGVDAVVCVLEVDVLDESDDAPRIPPRVPVATTKINGTNQAMPMTMAQVAFAELTPRRFASL